MTYTHGSDPHEPFLLQAEQFHLSEPHLIREMVQYLHHHCDTSFDSLEYTSCTGKPSTRLSAKAPSK